MDHHLLAVRPKRNSYSRHQRAAGARSIPGSPQIDVTRRQAQGAMIAVPAASDGRSHEGAAAAAFERVALIAPGPRAERDILPRSPRSRSGLASERISPRRGSQIVVYQMCQFVWRQAWHDRVLQPVLNDGQRGSIGAQARSSQHSLQTHDRQHGTPRAVTDAGETKGGRCLKRQTGRHDPPAHRNGKPERLAAREG
jgi:hypothetical protein